MARSPNQGAFITDNGWIMVGADRIIGAQPQPFEAIVDELGYPCRHLRQTAESTLCTGAGRVYQDSEAIRTIRAVPGEGVDAGRRLAGSGRLESDKRRSSK